MFIPTAISPREVRRLKAVVQARLALDIGSLLGFSVVQLSQVASKVVSVDRHEGYNGHTLAALSSNVARYACCPVEVVQAEATSRLAAGLVGEVAFVDLTGEESLTKQVLDLLDPRVRVCLIHDFSRPHCSGVHGAIRRSPQWTPVAQVDTLVELRR